MKPTEYIGSPRRGEDAHDMELEAMRDPFLAEALEGYEAVEGDHRANIERLETQLAARSKRGYMRRVLVALAIIGLLAAIIGGAIVLIRGDWSIESPQIVLATMPRQPIQTATPPTPLAPIIEIVDSTLLAPEQPRLPLEVPIDSVALKARRVERARVRAEQKQAELQDLQRAKSDTISKPINKPISEIIIPTQSPESTHMAVKAPQPPKTAEPTPPKSAEQPSEPSIHGAARFRGGDISAFRGWVEGRVKAPSIALVSTLSKPIIVSFVVNESGRLENITVDQNPNNELTEQVLKAIRRSPRWEPATNNGKATRSKVTIVTRPERWGK